VACPSSITNPQNPDPGPANVFASTLIVLTEAGRVHTPAGQNALALATWMDNADGVFRRRARRPCRCQHLAALEEALKDVEHADDLGDDLAARRRCGVQLLDLPTTDLRVPPAHVWVPEFTTTVAADDAVELIESVGFILDDEQKFALRVLMAEHGGSGRPSKPHWSVPDRISRPFSFKVIALYELFVVGSRLVVWTAHEFDTAMEAFRDLPGHHRRHRLDAPQDQDDGARRSRQGR